MQKYDYFSRISKNSHRVRFVGLAKQEENMQKRVI